MTILHESTATINGNGAPVLDIRGRGQQGALRRPADAASSSRYAKQHLIVALIDVPELLTKLPNSDILIETIRSLLEERATSITGFDSGITWSYEETVESHNGEMRETVTDAKRNRTVPSFEWPEVGHGAIQKLWEYVGTKILMDPETGKPGIITEPTYTKAPIPILDATQGFTLLAYEPTPSMDGIVHAWLVTDMKQKSAGEVTGSRVTGQALEAPTVPIEFTGMTDRGNAVKEMALAHLKSINKGGYDSLSVSAYATGVDGNVSGATNAGYVNGVNSNTVPTT